jgi:hypothetical protein
VLEPRGALRLRFLNGPQRGTVAILRPPHSRIGRSRNNDIILADHEGAAASAHHADAIHDGRQWWIHDLNSTHGTSLNGARITRAPFGAGDRLKFGDVECEVSRGRFAVTAAVAVTAAIGLIASFAYLAFSAREPDFEDVAASVARSVYTVAVETPTGRELIGTAFVVERGMLATNAHVAAPLRIPPSAPDRHAIVIRSDSGDVHRVDAVHVSPHWRTGTLANDVALLYVDDLAADSAPLPLADAATLGTLARGTSVATFGFPAISTDPAHPRGRLAIDVLGDVRDGQYLAVGLRIAPGTSGSPIFLRSGVVVGLVAGGDFVADPAGVLTPSGTNINWGLSVAPLQQLLRDRAAERR